MVRQRKLKEKWTTVATRDRDTSEETAMEAGGAAMMGPTVPTNGYVFNLI